MRIDLDHLVPHPMRQQDLSGSQIWNHEQHFEPSTRVLLRAPSGTGKSSLHSFLSGARHDYDGDFVIDGVKGRSMGVNAWAQVRSKQIALVFQDLRLIPELTVRENLQLKNRLTGIFKDADMQSMLEDVGIASKWDARCNELSLGQQQRVAIVRALLQPFSWLIADEPFSHLDDENIQRCLQLMHKRIKEEEAGFMLLSLGPDYGQSYDQILSL